MNTHSEDHDESPSTETTAPVRYCASIVVGIKVSGFGKSQIIRVLGHEKKCHQRFKEVWSLVVGALTARVRLSMHESTQVVMFMP
jgi:hypothetical protein